MMFNTIQGLFSKGYKHEPNQRFIAFCCGRH